MNSCMILSSWATTSIEEVAEANGSGLRWFQFHIFQDKTFTIDLVQQAECAGYKALVLRIDTPVIGRRLADARNKFNLPNGIKLVNFNTNSVQNSTDSQQKYV